MVRSRPASCDSRQGRPRRLLIRVRPVNICARTLIATLLWKVILVLPIFFYPGESLRSEHLRPGEMADGWRRAD
jgi:hypothetical protein